MILTSKNPIFGGWNMRATIRINPSMSSKRNPVLLIDGEPISPTGDCTFRVGCCKSKQERIRTA
jgi:hypothetical protein